jgi:hypothetical protein
VKTGMREIYFEVRTEDIAYVKFVIESYEGVGLIRTVLRQAQQGEGNRILERKKAVIVVLIVEDFLDDGRALLASLQSEIKLTEIPRPAEVGDDWLMTELAAESPSE